MRKNIQNINNLIIAITLILITYLVLVVSLGTQFITQEEGGFWEKILGYGLSFLAFVMVVYVTMRLKGITRGLNFDVKKAVVKAETEEDTKYKALIQNSLDVITIIDLQGHIQYQSPSSERILGYLPDELNNQSIFELIHAEDHSILKYALEQKSNTFFFSYRIQHRDGTWLWFESSGTNLLSNSLINGIVLNSRDITDRKKEEEQRKQKELAALKINLEREKTEKEKDAVEREKRIIEEGKAKLEEAYKVIEEKNHEITDSINYAFRIQRAIVPQMEDVMQSLPQAFVLWRPKDIVSGDFYWFADKDRYKLISAADCTGHGVPGAFMTMIGNTILNQIVLQNDHTMPDQILNNLHLGVRKALKQDQAGSQSRDGMDITFVVIDTQDNNKVYFAGANNPMIVVRNGEYTEFTPDKKSIGGLQTETERIFTLQTHDSQPGDVVYIYTDGFQDQFGGDRGRKFMTKRFKELLASIYTKPMEEQREILNTTIEEWMGTQYEQIDDILVIGIRF
ncbi:MAG: PAS domain S-box protein [Bacteroidetes bacterium]|nr:PAS domain S-box protein [Bacteroidota bacterium]